MTTATFPCEGPHRPHGTGRYRSSDYVAPHGSVRGKGGTGLGRGGRDRGGGGGAVGRGGRRPWSDATSGPEPEIVVCDVTERGRRARAAVGSVLERPRSARRAGQRGRRRRRPGHRRPAARRVAPRSSTSTSPGPSCSPRAALPALLESRGVIVNMGSVAGLRATPYNAAYCASKGGVIMLTKSMAIELAKAGVRVNAVCPASVDTPFLRGLRAPRRGGHVAARPGRVADGPADRARPRWRRPSPTWPRTKPPPSAGPPWSSTGPLPPDIGQRHRLGVAPGSQHPSRPLVGHRPVARPPRRPATKTWSTPTGPGVEALAPAGKVVEDGGRLGRRPRRGRRPPGRRGSPRRSGPAGAGRSGGPDGRSSSRPPPPTTAGPGPGPLRPAPRSGSWRGTSGRHGRRRPNRPSITRGSFHTDTRASQPSSVRPSDGVSEGRTTKSVRPSTRTTSMSTSIDVGALGPAAMSPRDRPDPLGVRVGHLHEAEVGQHADGPGRRRLGPGPQRRPGGRVGRRRRADRPGRGRGPPANRAGRPTGWSTASASCREGPGRSRGRPVSAARSDARSCCS